jgi:hypothetical protein
MLISIIAAHGGKLPEGVHVCFANTGKEREETLRFVQEVSNFYGVPIHWLERDGSKPPHERFREVDFESAARHGEPFEEVIREKQYLPNPVTRFCTVELKIRTMRDFAFAQGWTEWTNVIGFRADEKHRLAKAMRTSGDGEGKQMSLLSPKTPKRLRPSVATPHEAWNHLATPMIDAGVTRQTIADFWAQIPFDLRLRPHESNCDLCFLKGAGKVSAIIREHPSFAGWWVRMETMPLANKPEDQRFRHDRPDFAAIAEGVRLQAPLSFGEFDDLESCAENYCNAD